MWCLEIQSNMWAPDCSVMTNSKGHCLTRALRLSYTKLVIRMIGCICRYREGDDQYIFSLFDYQHIKQLRVRIRTRNRLFKKYTWNVFANSITYKRALVCKCPCNERLLWINSSVLQLGSMFSNNWACVTIVFICRFRHCSIVVIWYVKLVCLYSGNTWLCVHWQWNTREWCH